MPAPHKRLLRIISSVITLILSGMLISAVLLTHMDGSAQAISSPTFKAHNVEIVPIIDKIDMSRDSDPGETVKPVRFACQSNTNPRPVLCYGPYQIRRAYGVDQLFQQNITGQGSTITIIDAYGSPTLQSDLEAFDKIWGLSNPQLHIIQPFGQAQGDNSWVAETSLDVEWAHVMAPDAAINLVVARSSGDVDLYYALKYAVDHDLGDVISLSFGENENCIDPNLQLAEHSVLSDAAKQNITVIAAAGDTGSAQMSCDGHAYTEAVSFPASDPFVTAVGGTTLKADAVTGIYKSESTWNETGPFDKASGGGYSAIYTQPDYQAQITGNTPGRAVPDLALNASVNGGVLIYQSDPSGNKVTNTIMGGTSVGTPELAGLVADGVQMAHHRLGQINQPLYTIGAGSQYKHIMHDITSGNNILAVANLPGYTAGAGWDPATGWGSPGAAPAFLKALIALIPAPPSTPAPGGPASTPTPGTGTPAPSGPTSTPTPGASASTPVPGTLTGTPAPSGPTSTPAPGASASTPVPGALTGTPTPSGPTSTPAPGETQSTPVPTPSPEAPALPPDTPALPK